MHKLRFELKLNSLQIKIATYARNLTTFMQQSASSQKKCKRINLYRFLLCSFIKSQNQAC